VLGCEVLILLAHVLELAGRRIEDPNIGCQVLVSPVLTRH
jgi:hypothetical protein